MLVSGIMTTPVAPLDGLTKYRVLSLLGRGGMGEVYLAEHALLGHRVVVKVMHAELCARPHLVERMRLEAQVLARLRHPNLVRVTDHDATPGGRPYFVMEYLPGRSIGEAFKQHGRAFPLPFALEVAQQALAGLGHAHKAGLVHRDVKLDNLFLCDSATPAGHSLVKVLDFGVAKLLDGGSDGFAPLALPTATGVVVGTPRFFAPEQARGFAVDARADLYAFGLCLYTMVAGRGPFDDRATLIDLARAHVFEVPPPPSALAGAPLPRALDDLVLACLAKSPDDRPASAEVAMADLARIAASLA